MTDVAEDEDNSSPTSPAGTEDNHINTEMITLIWEIRSH